MAKVTLPKQVGQVVNATRGTTVASRPEIATSFLARGRGLMFRTSFEDGQAMIINPCSSIHMFFMRVPLDVLYLDSDHTVVRAQAGIKPWRVGPLHTRNAVYVIELPTGTISRSNTEVGDRIQIL